MILEDGANGNSANSQGGFGKGYTERNRVAAFICQLKRENAFQELVRQEQGHQNWLGQYLRGELKEGALSSGQAIDYKIAERFDQPEISPDMRLKDAFLLAANREKSSHEFYLSLAQIHPDGEVKKPVAWFSAAMTREVLREFLELIKDCERNMKESVSNFQICEPHRSK